MGSVFSPYYAWAGRRRPEDHVAINVAIYGKGARWAMTERGANALRRDATSFAVNASALRWTGGALDVELDEACAPIPLPIRGRVRLEPLALQPRVYPLDLNGGHIWRPIAPLARVTAQFEAPRLAWEGGGYFDANAGVEPLEKAFRRWTWSRRHLEPPARAAEVHYDVERRDGGLDRMSLRFDAGGGVVTCPAPPMRSLQRGFWGIERKARLAEPAQGVEPWEDAPFYTRTRVGASGGAVVCETLDLDRLKHPVVRAMLPFRMPRRP